MRADYVTCLGVMLKVTKSMEWFYMEMNDILIGGSILFMGRGMIEKLGIIRVGDSFNKLIEIYIRDGNTSD